MADRILIALNCPRCGGKVEVEEGEPLVICQFCGTTSLLSGDAEAPRLMVKMVLDEAAARERVKQWFSSGWKARDLAQKAEITEIYPAYLPFWRMTAYAQAIVCGFKKELRDIKKAVDMARKLGGQQQAAAGQPSAGAGTTAAQPGAAAPGGAPSAPAAPQAPPPPSGAAAAPSPPPPPTPPAGGIGTVPVGGGVTGGTATKVIILISILIITGGVVAGTTGIFNTPCPNFDPTGDWTWGVVPGYGTVTMTVSPAGTFSISSQTQPGKAEGATAYGKWVREGSYFVFKDYDPENKYPVKQVKLYSPQSACSVLMVRDPPLVPFVGKRPGSVSASKPTLPPLITSPPTITPVSTTRGGSTPVTTGTTKPSSTSCRCQDVTACVVEGSKLLCPVCVQGQDSNNDGLCDFRYVESMTPTPVSPTRETTASTTGKGSSGLPDLSLKKVTVPLSLPAGGSVTVDLEFENAGNGASGPFRINANLVNDDDSTDIHPIGEALTSGLAPGATGRWSFPFSIPSNIVSGDYLVIVRVDPSGLVDELNEDNNERQISVVVPSKQASGGTPIETWTTAVTTTRTTATVTTTGTAGTSSTVDFAITSIDIGLADCSGGSGACGTGEAMIGIKNNDLSAGHTVPVVIKFYDKDTGTDYFGQEYQVSLAAGESTLISRQFSMADLPEGPYYVAAKIHVTDANSQNNEKRANKIIEVA